MYTKQINLSEHCSFKVDSINDMKIGIVTSEWNGNITDSLFSGAFNTLLEYGISKSNILSIRVPGSYELPFGADMLLKQINSLDAVICLGCIIQGETRHFEFISQAVSHGIMDVSMRYHKPVIFGVLTCDTMEQAIDRTGGSHGNKGIEAAVACVKMLDLQCNKLKSTELEAILSPHLTRQQLPIEELMKNPVPQRHTHSILPIEEYQTEEHNDFSVAELKSLAKNDNNLPIEELLP